MRINSIDFIGFGDSLMLGTALACYIPHNAKIGRQPHEVLAAIKGTDKSLITGKNVILSTGISNNPNGKSYVEQQFALLYSYGAKHIIVIGTGPGNSNVDLSDANEYIDKTIKKMYTTYNIKPDTFVFTGPLVLPDIGIRMNGDLPGIHPYDYQDIVDKINSLIENL